PRRTTWERQTRMSPSAPATTPASTKPIRGSAEERSATAASTIPHPASSNRKPASFIVQASSYGAYPRASVVPAREPVNRIFLLCLEVETQYKTLISGIETIHFTKAASPLTMRSIEESSFKK